MHAERCHGGGSSIEYPSSALTYRVAVPNGVADGVAMRVGEADGVGVNAVPVGRGEGDVTATSRDPASEMATTATTTAASTAASATARFRFTA
jgi:hypothetical protein